MKSSQNTKNPRRSADIKRSSTKKRGGSSRESRAIPIITCTMWQVGRLSSASPLPTSALRQSAGGRSAIVGRSTASRNYNVGLSGTVTHSAGVRSIFAKAAVLERQKPRRVFAAHGEKRFGSFLPAACTSAKIQLRLQVWNFCACAKIMRAAGCKPFQTETQRSGFRLRIFSKTCF